MKIKVITNTLIASSAAILSSCYTIPSALTNGISSPLGGGGLGLSQSPRSSETSSSGNSNIGIPINNPNAKKFADAVVSMQVGSSTKEDALANLGGPSTKSQMGGGEVWQYALNTGAMPAMGVLYFQGGTMIGVEVIKTGMSGGTISTETVFKKGAKLTP